MSDTPTPEQDLVAALGALVDPPKDGKVNAGNRRYTYLTLADLLGAVRPVFAAHRLAVLQLVENTDTGIQVTTRIMHTSGWVFDSPPLHMRCSQDAQAIGSATTYGRRYSLAALVGLAGDDDDGQAAQPVRATANYEQTNDRDAEARQVEPLTRPVTRTHPKAPEPDPWQTPPPPPPPRPAVLAGDPGGKPPSLASDKSIKMMWVLQKKSGMTPEEFRPWVAALLALDEQWHTANLTQPQVSAIIKRLQDDTPPPEDG